MGITLFSYGTPSCLMLNDVPMKSFCGVKQGDPMGPLLFSLAIHETLRSTVEDLGPDIILCAYLDDVAFLGPPTLVKRAYVILEERFGRLGLLINRTKCCVSTRDQCQFQLLESLGVQQSLFGQKLLDAYVACEPTRETNWTLNQVPKFEEFLSRIPLLSKQCAWAVLRHWCAAVESHTQMSSSRDHGESECQSRFSDH